MQNAVTLRQYSYPTIAVLLPRHRELEEVVDGSKLQSNLEDALATELGFLGAYTFNKAYACAPNPRLKIDGLGTIGVPLSTRDAEAIKSKVEQVPFGTEVNPRAAIDGDTWEIDAKLVTFTNPKWGTFMQNSVKEVCKVLGVDCAASQPRCVPYKLLLSGTGSQSLSHTSIEKTGAEFATILVVLPSEYTGGEVLTSHHSVNATYDCSQTSIDTTFIAWYNGVTHTVKPINSGYRFAVSFKLVHTTDSICPVISTNSAFIENVTRALLAWKEAKGPSVQEKIVYLLEQRYPAAKLRRDALEGVDAVTVSLLHQIGHELGFSLGLATAVCTLSGPADDDRRRYCVDYWDAEVDFMEIEVRQTRIKGFVDLDGNPISDTLPIDEFRDNPETIPSDLSEDVEQEEHDGEVYNALNSKPNRENPLERWYYRTVLVIWPNENTYKVAYAGQGLNYACANLDKADKPSESLAHLVDFVLSRAAESPSRVITSVCRAALRWDDYPLWRKAAGTCFWDNRVASLPFRVLAKAMGIFGTRRVREVLEQELRSSPSHMGVLQLLAGLEEMMNKIPERDDDGETISVWLRRQRGSALKNLKKLDHDEVALVIQSAILHGGFLFLEERVIPQLLENSSPEVLLGVAVEIRRHSSNDSSKRMELISKLITTAITKFDFFQDSLPQSFSFFSRPKANVVPKIPDIDSFKKFLDICRETECTDGLTLLLEQARLTRGLSTTTDHKRAHTVMLPLLDYLGHGDPIAFPQQSVKALAETAVLCSLSGAAGHEIDAARIKLMVQTLKAVGGGNDSIQRSILPKILSDDVPPEYLVILAEEVMRLGGEDSVGRDMIDSLSLSFAKRVQLTGKTTILDALERCRKCGVPEACSLIIERIIDGTPQANATQLQQKLVPLLSPIRTFSLSYPRLEDVRINALLQAIIKRWVEIVLGPRPAQDRSGLISFTRWKCDCVPCQSAKTLLSNPSIDRTSTALGRLHASSGRHLEECIKLYAPGAATVMVNRHGHSRTPGLVISLSDQTTQPLRWEKNRLMGIKMLRDIAVDENELQVILGEYYQSVLQCLEVRRITEDAIAPALCPDTAPSVSTLQGSSTDDREPPPKKRKTIPDQVNSAHST